MLYSFSVCDVGVSNISLDCFDSFSNFELFKKDIKVVLYIRHVAKLISD